MNWTLSQKIFFFLPLINVVACLDKPTLPQDFDIDPHREIATNVELIYSDSAIVRFRLLADRQETYEEESKMVEEYPAGLFIEFFDRQQKVTSSMRADYAVRVSADGLMTLRDNVVLINDKGDRLTTRGIVWDELNHTLKTAKLVQMIKATAEDTIYGFGFEAKDDFSQFQINQATLKRKHQSLTEGIDE